MGLVENPINPESKGCNNLGRGSPKDLAKAQRNEGLKWVEDAQRNKMGQGSPKGMKRAKEAQNSMSTSPMIVLGYWN